MVVVVEGRTDLALRHEVLEEGGGAAGGEGGEAHA